VDGKGKGYVAGGRGGIYFRAAPVDVHGRATRGRHPILVIAAGLMVALVILGTL